MDRIQFTQIKNTLYVKSLSSLEYYSNYFTSSILILLLVKYYTFIVLRYLLPLSLIPIMYKHSSATLSPTI
ncbi:Hypothetical Protein SiL_0155 [Sulfolobus islandicus LAL14/1]|uniref:Uncharacterized protein n=1 Tax=Saccharolobus islandicus LAL14/1 TaxID=1241935 RepID=M9U3P3_SACIS|nr:Hypothetical Protein SiL_0155 [Sulfolobus islandicus LAL14/1]